MSALTAKKKSKLESVGQMSFLDDLDATIDRLLKEVGCPDEVVWTEEDISRLKKAMLLDSLKQLRQVRLSEATRGEILGWIQEPLKSEGYAIPFSFQDCCIASDLYAEEMQPHLIRMFVTKH
jgi:hypothetical protein